MKLIRKQRNGYALLFAASIYLAVWLGAVGYGSALMCVAAALIIKSSAQMMKPGAKFVFTADGTSFSASKRDHNDKEWGVMTCQR